MGFGFGFGFRPGRARAQHKGVSVSLTAPTLTWDTASSDNTPQFTVTFTSAAQVGDTVEFQIDDDPAFGSASDTSDTVDAGEVTANDVVLTLAALTDGTYSARARHVRGATVSDWSSTVTVTISTVTFSGSYLTSAVDAVDRNTYTFAAQTLGAEAADRLIVVAVNSRGSTTISSVTVAGIAGSLVNSQISATSSITAFYVAAVPTGLTGDVVVAFSGGFPARCGIGLWRVSGAATTVPAGVNTAKASVGGGATSISTSLTVPAGGFWIGSVGGIIGTAGAFASWSVGAERYDGSVEGGIVHAGADGTDAGSVPITVNFSEAISASTGAGIVVAAWGP